MQISPCRRYHLPVPWQCSTSRYQLRHLAYSPLYSTPSTPFEPQTGFSNRLYKTREAYPSTPVPQSMYVRNRRHSSDDMSISYHTASLYDPVPAPWSGLNPMTPSAWTTNAARSTTFSQGKVATGPYSLSPPSRRASYQVLSGLRLFQTSNHGIWHHHHLRLLEIATRTIPGADSERPPDGRHMSVCCGMSHLPLPLKPQAW